MLISKFLFLDYRLAAGLTATPFIAFLLLSFGFGLVGRYGYIFAICMSHFSLLFWFTSLSHGFQPLSTHPNRPYPTYAQ
ncbi:hypothetical protein BJY52DRAFT_1302885 [Lactarius psammicola]|nr:hypothetical protein BJY52DRAFT_1302885 [Lactarius psammicola]